MHSNLHPSFQKKIVPSQLPPSLGQAVILMVLKEVRKKRPIEEVLDCDGDLNFTPHVKYCYEQ